LFAFRAERYIQPPINADGNKISVGMTQFHVSLSARINWPEKKKSEWLREWNNPEISGTKIVPEIACRKQGRYTKHSTNPKNKQKSVKFLMTQIRAI
jgi:hypothetical protein